MSVEIERSPNFDRNQKHADGELPHCYLCGKSIEHPQHWIHIFWGWTVVSEVEAEQLIAAGNEPGDMYFFPIGAECLRKRPELKPYTQHFEEAVDVEVVTED